MGYNSVADNTAVSSFV